MIERGARKRLGALLCGALALLGGGCVIYPTATQPGIAFHVRDEAGRAVEGAKVTQVSFCRRYAFMRELWIERKSDAYGVVNIPRKMKQQVLFDMAKGSVYYDWAWCVEKPGYLPVIRNDLKKDGVRKIEEVVLKRAGPPWEATWYKPSRKFVVER